VTKREPLELLAAFIESVPAGETQNYRALYEIKSLYLAASEESKTKLLFDFHAYPFREPVTHLLQTRDRWIDTGTATWLTADARGTTDSSNLYAFCGADPVDCVDPTGLSGWDPAAWGRWIVDKANAAKQKVGAVSIALTPNTGTSLLDGIINAEVGNAEFVVNCSIDIVSGIPAHLLLIGDETGTAIVEEGGVHDAYSATRIIGDALIDAGAVASYALLPATLARSPSQPAAVARIRINLNNAGPLKGRSVPFGLTNAGLLGPFRVQAVEVRCI
jgi:RHS repeat-associated protein